MKRFLCCLWSLIVAAVGIGLVYLVAMNQVLYDAYLTFVAAITALNLQFVALTIVSVLLIPFVWRLNKIAQFKLRKMWHMWHACHGDEGSCKSCQSLCGRCSSSNCSAKH